MGGVDEEEDGEGWRTTVAAWNKTVNNKLTCRPQA